MAENPMTTVKIEKVTLNIGCGNDKEKIDRAKKLLELLAEQKPTLTLSKRRSTFGVIKGTPLGVKVTLRKDKAEGFFKRVLQAVDNKVKPTQLDNEGNINIGLKEYIDLPNIKYNHEVGMLGLNCSVTLQKSGYRIKHRRIQQRNIPSKSKINKEETINWLIQRGVKVE